MARTHSVLAALATLATLAAAGQWAEEAAAVARGSHYRCRYREEWAQRPLHLEQHPCNPKEFHSPAGWRYRAGLLPYVLSPASAAVGNFRTLSLPALASLLNASAHRVFSVNANDGRHSMAPAAPLPARHEPPAAYLRRALEPEVTGAAGRRLAAHAGSWPSHAGDPKAPGFLHLPYIISSLGGAGMAAVFAHAAAGVLEHRLRDADWQEGCLGAHPPLVEAWTAGMPWQMLLYGSYGTGSAAHYDMTPTAAWQLQVTGAKTWVVCPPVGTVGDWFSLPDGASADLLAPDLAAVPHAAAAGCQAGEVAAGEAVFYPAHWVHQTVNAAPWSLGVSMHQVHGPQVPALAAFLEHKIASFEATQFEEGVPLSTDYMPLTPSARALAPKCAAWWEDGLLGAFAVGRDTCSDAERSAQLAQLEVLLARNAEEDAASLAGL